MKCPKCGSKDVKFIGSDSDGQNTKMYECQNCGSHFNEAGW